METAIFSESLECENKDLFALAKSKGYDAVILNYYRNNLFKLPSRNYYALQSLKTQMPIAGIFLDQLEADISPESQVEKLIELVDVVRNMKINFILISGETLNQFDTEPLRESAIQILKFLCKYSEAYDIGIAIYDAIDGEILDDLMDRVPMPNLIYVDEILGDYDLLS